MKKLRSIPVFLILISVNNLFGQNFSFGFNYSSILTGRNYNSVSFYSFEWDYGIIHNTLSAGFAVTGVSARIESSFIKNPPPANPYELSYKFGIDVKYYPLMDKENSSSFKPYICVEVGKYISDYISTYFNMLDNCEDDYSIKLPNTIYTDIILGTDIFPNEKIGLNIRCGYQIFNPTINYEKPICIEDMVTGHTKYREKVNLNMLLWSIGFKINF